LLGPHKELGRKLRTKSLAVITCSGDNDIIEGMYMPFIESAKYLGMDYLGHVHGWLDSNGKIDTYSISLLDKFVTNLQT